MIADNVSISMPTTSRKALISSSRTIGSETMLPMRSPIIVGTLSSVRARPKAEPVPAMIRIGAIVSAVPDMTRRMSR